MKVPIYATGFDTNKLLLNLLEATRERDDIDFREIGRIHGAHQMGEITGGTLIVGPNADPEVVDTARALGLDVQAAELQGLG